MNDDNSSKRVPRRANIEISPEIMRCVRIFRDWNRLENLVTAYGDLIELGIERAREVGKMPTGDS